MVIKAGPRNNENGRISNRSPRRSQGVRATSHPLLFVIYKYLLLKYILFKISEWITPCLPDKHTHELHPILAKFQATSSTQFFPKLFKLPISSMGNYLIELYLENMYTY